MPMPTNVGFTVITDFIWSYDRDIFRTLIYIYDGASCETSYGFQPLPTSAKSSILDIWHSFGYVSVLWARLIDVQISGKKSNFIWYFVKFSHSRILRRKKFFDFNSAKKRVSLSVKPSTTYTSSNKDTAYPDIKRHVFSSPTSFSCKMRSKNLRSYNSKTLVNSNKFFWPLRVRNAWALL